MVSRFWQKFSEGEIHFRDDWQFELKSEFSPSPDRKKNRYSQEFYLFIPNALRINKNTYSREEFYLDQTSLIRYKTPEIAFSDLLDDENEDSPFYRLKRGEVRVGKVDKELKLLGNIVRSQLRDRIRDAVYRLSSGSDMLGNDILELLNELIQVRQEYKALKQLALPEVTYRYVGEFIDLSYQVYLTGFLEDLRRQGGEGLEEADQAICTLIKECTTESVSTEGTDAEREYVLYRKGLLNKFVLDALLLSIDRKAVVEQYRNLSGMIAAGFAMLIYMIFFVWQGEYFVINSFPFVFLTVFLYILKDRLKEGIKVLYSEQAVRYFPDYETEIRTPNKELQLGKLRETLNFVPLEKAPKEIIRARNEGFHTELEAFRRPESLMLYKQEVSLQRHALQEMGRRHELNMIFRFNVHRFLEKASNPWQSFPALNPEDDSVSRVSLPKVYHLNIIVRNRYKDSEENEEVEIQKFRCILDKRGIKRIDQVR